MKFGLLALSGALTAIFLVLASTALAAEPPSYNMQGTWTNGYLSGSARGPANGSYDITAMNMTTGVLSGTAEVEEEHFVVEGTEEGSVAHFTLTLGGYVAYDTLHLSILPNGHLGGNGTFNSDGGYSESGAGFWAEQNGASGEEPGKKPKKKKPPKKPKKKPKNQPSVPRRRW
jgi:hypothetical protein